MPQCRAKQNFPVHITACAVSFFSSNMGRIRHATHPVHLSVASAECKVLEPRFQAIKNPETCQSTHIVGPVAFKVLDFTKRNDRRHLPSILFGQNRDGQCAHCLRPLKGISLTSCRLPRYLPTYLKTNPPSPNQHPAMEWQEA